MQQSSNPNSTGSVDNSSQSNVIPDAKTVGKENPNAQEIIINSMITTKDVRDSLWRCRDFELSHLWQRSILLTTILILCFTGYGVVIMKLCDKVEGIIDSSYYLFNNIALALCLVNILFSCFWIMMAKGSKAWYERYERAIDAFEKNENYVDDEVISTGVNQDDLKRRPIGGFQCQNIKEYKRAEIKDQIFSCKGGAYSPSKINIAIGQISFLLWCVAFMTHCLLSFTHFQFNQVWMEFYIPLFLLLLFIGMLIIIYFSTHKRFNGKWIKSSELHKF